MGQSLRRGPDRADRLLLRLLPPWACLRHAADARHGLPLQAVLPDQGARIAQVDLRPEAIWAAAPRSSLGVIGDIRCDDLQALLPQLTGQDRTISHLKASDRPLSQDARKGLDELASGKPGGKLPIHQQYLPRVHQPGGSGGRRDLHLRTWELPTVWAARYLSDERPPPPDRARSGCMVPWRTRCPRRSARRLRFPGPAGGVPVRRRRLHHADGRPPHRQTQLKPARSRSSCSTTACSDSLRWR